jgi:hypothetical protein
VGVVGCSAPDDLGSGRGAFLDATIEPELLHARGRPKISDGSCVEENMDFQHKARIRELNDSFRRSFVGGSVMITAGVEALSAALRAKLLAGVRSFDAFDVPNDPHHEHDFGAVDLDGRRCFWKIDYYDRDLRCGSEDPADPEVTTRVLTVMLAEEY